MQKPAAVKTCNPTSPFQSMQNAPQLQNVNVVTSPVRVRVRHHPRPSARVDWCPWCRIRAVEDPKVKPYVGSSEFHPPQEVMHQLNPKVLLPLMTHKGLGGSYPRRLLHLPAGQEGQLLCFSLLIVHLSFRAVISPFFLCWSSQSHLFVPFLNDYTVTDRPCLALEAWVVRSPERVVKFQKWMKKKLSQLWMGSEGGWKRIQWMGSLPFNVELTWRCRF